MNLVDSTDLAILIQARVGSTRFPKKVLAKIENKPMIWHVINRMRTVTDNIILLTTKKTEDRILLKIAQDSGVMGFRGHTFDVLRRYYDCAKQFKVNTIIRITGDCPLIDPIIVKKMIKLYKSKNFDYLSNTIIPTLPDGLDTEIFSFKTLEIMNKNARLPSEREHVTPYIRNNLHRFKTHNYKNAKDLSNLRWTVDEQRDLQFVRKVYFHMRPKLIFSMRDVLKIIRKNPEITRINQDIMRNEGYLTSLAKDKK